MHMWATFPAKKIYPIIANKNGAYLSCIIDIDLDYL